MKCKGFGRVCAEKENSLSRVYSTTENRSANTGNLDINSFLCLRTKMMRMHFMVIAQIKAQLEHIQIIQVVIACGGRDLWNIFYPSHDKSQIKFDNVTVFCIEIQYVWLFEMSAPLVKLVTVMGRRLECDCLSQCKPRSLLRVKSNEGLDHEYFRASLDFPVSSVPQVWNGDGPLGTQNWRRKHIASSEIFARANRPATIISWATTTCGLRFLWQPLFELSCLCLLQAYRTWPP